MDSQHELNLSYFEKILSAQKEEVTKNLAVGLANPTARFIVNV